MLCCACFLNSPALPSPLPTIRSGTWGDQLALFSVLQRAHPQSERRPTGLFPPRQTSNWATPKTEPPRSPVSRRTLGMYGWPTR